MVILLCVLLFIVLILLLASAKHMILHVQYIVSLFIIIMKENS